MFKFFDWFIDFFSTIFDFVINTFKGVISLLSQIGNSFGFIKTTITYLPTFCQGAIIAVIAICILCVILSVIVDPS